MLLRLMILVAKITEGSAAWQRKEGKNKSGGLNEKDASPMSVRILLVISKLL